MNWSQPVKFFLLFVITLCSGLEVHSWGFHAHRLINRKAVYYLPDDMFLFYKRHVEYISEHAVDPDKRRYAVKEEGPRHYIDLDHYVSSGSSLNMTELQEAIPLRWNKAEELYTEDSLNEYGIVPWHLNLMVIRLTRAFEEGNAEQILKLSSEIGHYASDAHVPLHTTENYNGQLTGQKGIHALWESRIPERKSDEYAFDTKGCRYLENVQYNIWEVVIESHQQVGYVLKTEKELRDSFPSDKMYRPSTVGRKVTPQYTSAYVEAYCATNADLVEQRVKQSCVFIASLWFTAWVNAGQPDLSRLKFEEEGNDWKQSKGQSDHER